MKNRLRIYLDTSVPNFLYADDAPEKKGITIDFFDNYVSKGIYEAYISFYVIAEIEDTKDSAKREQLLNSVKSYGLELLEVDEVIQEIEELGNQYVEQGIIPAKNYIDAYHIAASVVCKMDYLVSWNYRHLANVNKERSVHIVNLQNNYPDHLRILTPIELIYDES